MSTTVRKSEGSWSLPQTETAISTFEAGFAKFQKNELVGSPKTKLNSITFDDLDLESYLETSVTVVEWGEGLADRFSKEYLEINIAFGSGENDRVVSTTPHGARWLGFDL